MASVINATTGGLVTTADISGILQLATNNGSTAITIDASQNVGIWTSSPAYKLDVNGSARIGTGSNNSMRVSTDGPNNFQIFNSALTGNGTDFALEQNYLGTTYINAASGQSIYLLIANTAKAVLDSSGNLGLGVTPSSYLQTIPQFQFGATSVLAGGLHNTFLGENMAFTNSGAAAKYIVSGYGATMYYQWQGQHQWYIAPSGTAGNAISYTQAMTLDANGTLLVGTTSAPSTNNVLAMVVGKNPKMYFFSDPTQSQAATNGIRVDTYGNSKWAGYAFNSGSGVYTNSSYPTTTYIASVSSNAIAFGSMNNNPFENTSSVNAFSEFARIDGSGNLLIGTTTTVASAKAVVSSTTQGFLPPVMTTTQKNAISSPAAGLIVFDTTLAKLCVYSGSAWQTITSV